MKKIYLLLAVLIFTILPPMVVNAENTNFYEGEYLPDAYIKKFKTGATTGKYEHMRVFRRVGDNAPAYCIQLWELLNSTQPMTQTRIENYNLLTKEIWHQVELIAYYGYGYHNHMDLSWYTATQFLIWKTISTDSIIYFTDTLNGNKTEKFTAEIQEIQNLVKRHMVLPSFHANNYTVGLGEELILQDTNQVVNDYYIYENPELKIEKNQNSIKIIPNKVGKTTIQLQKGTMENQTKLYTSSESQDLIVRGNYAPQTSYINLEVVGGELSLIKLDQDTNSKTPQGDAKLEGTVYQLYDEQMNPVKTLTIDASNHAIISNLPFGKYYLKEKEAGIGYHLDQNTYTIEFTKENRKVALTLTNRVKTGTIKIQKEYEPLNTAECYPEENAVFAFYDKNNQKVGEIKTNIDGYGEYKLPYGTYLVKQINGKENYTMVEDFYVDVKEDSSISQYHLVNKEIGHSIKIIKIDKDSKLPIRFSKTKFKIKDLKTNRYLAYKNKDIYETNDKGVLEFPFLLGVGFYQLEEIESPIGYQSLNTPYVFEIEANSESVVELSIENTKQTGSLEILKQGETIKIENNQMSYDTKPLEQVEFSIYAQEDIMSKDGTIHFYKNQLVEIQKTNAEGKIKFNNLLYGKYYILETRSLVSFLEDSRKYYVEINKNKLNMKLENLNILKKGTIKIMKLDDENLLGIPKTEFEIYNSQMEIISTIKTDREGIAYIYNLPLGSYFIKEKNVPFPYLLKDEITKVQIKNHEEIVEVILKNRKQKLEEPVPNTFIERENQTFCDLLFLFEVGILYLRKKYKTL